MISNIAIYRPEEWMELLFIPFQLIEFLDWHAVSHNEALGVSVVVIVSRLGPDALVRMVSRLGSEDNLFCFCYTIVWVGSF